NKEIEWVGHGSDNIGSELSSKIEKMDKKEVVAELNKLRSRKIVVSKYEFNENDIIILNANNYGPLDPNTESVINTPGTRKRLDLTLKAFMKLLTIHPNKNSIKLWIHTNLKSFFDMLAIENISLSTLADNIILSSNNVTNEQL